MPIKFGKTGRDYDNRTGKTSVVYNYMKCKSKSDLIEAFNNERTKPKLRAKIRIELVRRGGVVFNNKEEEHYG